MLSRGRAESTFLTRLTNDAQEIRPKAMPMQQKPLVNCSGKPHEHLMKPARIAGSGKAQISLGTPNRTVSASATRPTLMVGRVLNGDFTRRCLLPASEHSVFPAIQKE